MIAALPTCLGFSALAAQEPGISIGRFFADTPRTTYRLGFSSSLVGPLGTDLYGIVLDGAAPSRTLWGGGIDLSLFRGGRPGGYLVGGVAGGLSPGSGRDFWGAWSAGLGYEIRPLDGLSLGAEARWRTVTPGRHDGLELGIRLGLDLGHRAGSSGSPLPGRELGPADVPDSLATFRIASEAGVPSSRAELLSGVVRTATDVMGTPYKWGGNGGDDEGFDCSGLIRYAYHSHGIELPRRSVDQAREGRPVDRSIEALLPGDVLTFSNSGGVVTHVGLYVGDGKFIHSASGGVRLSILSQDDTYGRWWWNRWVGARRIVE